MPARQRTSTGLRASVVAFAAAAPLGLGAVVDAQTAAAPRPDPRAQEDYGTYCGTCHQFDGRGVEGVYPSLAASAIVTGDPRTLARLVLDGGFRNNAMPQFRGVLTDEQAARILTFIRGSWGNAASPVATTEVASLAP